jgi:hypothetical protein
MAEAAPCLPVPLLPDYGGFDRLPAGATVGAVHVNKCRVCRCMVGTPHSESGFEYCAAGGNCMRRRKRTRFVGRQYGKKWELRQARDPTIIDLYHQVNWSLRMHWKRRQGSGMLIGANVTQPDRAYAHRQAHSKRQAIVWRQRLDCACRRVRIGRR